MPWTEEERKKHDEGMLKLRELYEAFPDVWAKLHSDETLFDEFMEVGEVELAFDMWWRYLKSLRESLTPKEISEIQVVADLLSDRPFDGVPLRGTEQVGWKHGTPFIVEVEFNIR